MGGVGSWCAESLVRSGVQHLTIVYSDELLQPHGEGKGSIVHITAIFGFVLAGLVIQDIIK